MRKSVLSAVIAATLISSAQVGTIAIGALFAGASPAKAQSANDAYQYDEARDPAYRAAAQGAYYGSSSYYNVPPCFLFTCLLGGGHKPRDGELRTLPDGTTVSYDKRSNRWLVVHEPQEQPRGVYTDRDVYAAT